MKKSMQKKIVKKLIHLLDYMVGVDWNGSFLENNCGWMWGHDDISDITKFIEELATVHSSAWDNWDWRDLLSDFNELYSHVKREKGI